jgi:predicted O-methyltransferase YrrM
MKRSTISMPLDLARIRWALRGLPDIPLALTLHRISTHTMTRPRRAKALWKLCRDTLSTGIPGAFVECGVWLGGSAGLMAEAIGHFEKGSHRKLHLFDSFEGLPAPGTEDGEKAAEYWRSTEGSEHVMVHRCVAGAALVRSFLHEYLRIPRERVVFHEGWFHDTLPRLDPDFGAIAVLRLDGDWYDSTRICFEHLYHRLSPGGVVLLDDYFCWEGCRKATDEFRALKNITEPIVRIDSDSGYWIKKIES